MNRLPKDEAREERIHSEIVVDAYGPEEHAMSWYYYVDDQLSYASGLVRARCIAERAISPLKVGDEVEILGMAPEEECRSELFVMIRWGRPGGKEGLGVPLSQLEVLDDDELAHEVVQAVQDWHYWVARGYEF